MFNVYAYMRMISKVCMHIDSGKNLYDAACVNNSTSHRGGFECPFDSAIFPEQRNEFDSLHPSILD